MDHLGFPVRRLTRTQIGPVVLQGLLSGELREPDARRARRAAGQREAVAAAWPCPRRSRRTSPPWWRTTSTWAGRACTADCPRTTLTFVLPVDEPLEASWAGRSGQPDPRLVDACRGCTRAPAEIHHEGTQRGVQLALTPAGARALLGVPAAALAGELLELATATRPGPAAPAGAAGGGAPTRPAGPTLVERAAASRCAAHGDASVPAASVGRALARLTRGAGVQEVAAEVGRQPPPPRRPWCARSAGWRPRSCSGVGRFERSRALLGRRPLAEVAPRCGYADQAHLTREWGELAGCPPTTWLREEFPFLQDQRVAGERRLRRMTAAADVQSLAHHVLPRRRRDDRVALRGRVHRARDVPRRRGPVRRRARRVAVARRRRDWCSARQRPDARSTTSAASAAYLVVERPGRRLRPVPWPPARPCSDRWSTRTTEAAAAASRIQKATTGRSGATSLR